MAVKSVTMVACAIVLGTVLSGCSSEDPQTSPQQVVMDSGAIKELARQAEEAGNVEQAEALTDGVVSFDEYEAAFGQVAKCLSKAGISVTAPLMSPITGDRYEFSMEFGTLDQSVAVAESDRCNAEHFMAVSQAYAFSTPDVMEVPLRQPTADCLRELGVEATGEEANAKAFADLPNAKPEDVSACIVAAAQDLYPEYPALSVAF